MALKPNASYKTANGLTVCEKIIPDGTVWKDEAKAKAAKFAAGALYKKQQKLCGNGKPAYVTVHTTDDLPQVEDDAEQYTRATYNENMGSARPHFYVDDVAVWQRSSTPSREPCTLCSNRVSVSSRFLIVALSRFMESPVSWICSFCRWVTSCFCVWRI